MPPHCGPATAGLIDYIKYRFGGSGQEHPQPWLLTVRRIILCSHSCRIPPENGKDARPRPGTWEKDMPSHRIVIVDDHPLFRGALSQAINAAFQSAEIIEAISGIGEGSRGSRSVFTCPPLRA